MEEFKKMETISSRLVGKEKVEFQKACNVIDKYFIRILDSMKGILEEVPRIEYSGTEVQEAIKTINTFAKKTGVNLKIPTEIRSFLNYIYEYGIKIVKS